ncbi:MULTISPECIES: P-loop NTPase fold protein [unclassified Sphingobacterium]|uniref:P-loop NTPase fold protein n=1 Tax=unclassified Sphingobacterium TaxID=2609468 RepID=UPI0025D0FB79|nr:MULTISPECIES: P-loop NTPase fold protein [unclassified Sphingobacterium]
MDNKHIESYLDFYVKSNEVKFAVMLSGKWGSGKTFFIKKIIEKWENESEVLKKDEIYLKPIYASLNGVSSKKEVVDILKAKISPFFYSKGIKATKKILSGVLKTTLKIDFDFNQDGNKDAILDFKPDSLFFFKLDSEKITGNKILIFDDIERCKLPIDELFGFLNDFIEHSKCKVILVTDESKLEETSREESKFEYKKFKEKIIGRTFELKSNSDSIIDEFLKKGNNQINGRYEDFQKITSEIFTCSKTKNFRVLQMALFEFERLCKFINPKIMEDKDRSAIVIKNYYPYFLIYFLEYQTGNPIKPNEADIFHFTNHYVNKDYREILDRYTVTQTDILFQDNNLSDYIQKGAHELLVKDIETSNLLKPERVSKDWEHLWFWFDLESNEFDRLRKSVEEEFYEENNLEITEILHVSGILLRLIDEGLLMDNSKEKVLKRAKELIENTEISDLAILHEMKYVTENSWGKQYHSLRTNEFQKLLEIAKEKIDKMKHKISRRAICEKLKDLKDNNISDTLYGLHQDIAEFSHKDQIFGIITTDEFVRIVLALNNSATKIFANFIKKRYKEIESDTAEFLVYKEELKYLREFYEKLHEYQINNEIHPLRSIKLKFLQEEIKSAIERIDMSLNVEN